MASETLFFAVASISLSTYKGRKPCTLRSAAEHNKRQSICTLIEQGRIDPARTSLNYCLMGAADADGVVNRANELMTGVSVKTDKLRKDFAQAIEIVASLPSGTSIDTDAYFRDVLAWCVQQFTAAYILSFDVHLDESAPHCHLLLAPIQDSRWVGAKFIERDRVKLMRQSFADSVAGRYGLKLSDKLRGSRKADAVAQVIRTIENEHQGLILTNLWLPIRRAIEAHPEWFCDALGVSVSDKPEPTPKTMAQIFTSPGAGPKSEKPIGFAKTKPIGFEVEPAIKNYSKVKPIGFENDAEKSETYLCGFRSPISPNTPDDGITRIREPDPWSDDIQFTDWQDDSWPDEVSA